MKRRTSVAAPNFLLKHSNPAIGAVFFQMGSFDGEGEMRGRGLDGFVESWCEGRMGTRYKIYI